jgi:hypothetical protein
MVFRLTRSFAMVPVGAVVLVVLIVVGVVLFNSMLTKATQPTLTGSVVLTTTSQGPELGISYFNQGNRPASLPPLTVPLLVAGGFPFTVGASGLGPSITASSGGITLVPSAAVPSACTPGLSLSSPVSERYMFVSGVSLLGPATLSAVFAGNSSWPAGGYGLMLASTFSDLFVLQTSGNGSTTATVAYDNYSRSAGAILGQFVRSPPFAFDTNVSTVFTVALSGLGGFVASVDGIPRLNGSLAHFLPDASPLAVWATNNSSVTGLVVSVDGKSLWMGPTATCGAQLMLPLLSSGRPDIVSNATPSWVVGPIPGASPALGALYLLEVRYVGASAPSPVSVADCSAVLLGVNVTLAFSAPWVG